MYISAYMHVCKHKSKPVTESLALCNDYFNLVTEKGRLHSSLFLGEKSRYLFSFIILTLWKPEEFSVEEFFRKICTISSATCFFVSNKNSILQGTVEGKRKRGRQRKRWTDNAEEWTGKPFAETQALAHHGNWWRRLAHSLSRWCPNNPTGS